MRSSVTSLIDTSHRLKKLTVYALCLSLLAWGGWVGGERLLNPERPKGAARSRTDIAARALRIGTVLNGSARLLSPPVFLKGSRHASAFGSISRNAWVVLCEAGNQQLNMVFNDQSGRIACMVMNSTTLNSTAVNKDRSLLPPIRTAAEAAVVATNRLKALEVLPQGAQIALEDTHLQKDAQNLWEMKWRVRTSPNSLPYTIKIALNKTTGLPTRMVDGHTAQ